MMMLMLINLIFLSSILSFSSLYPHLLISLMSLEIIMISSILMIFYTLLLINMQFFIMIMLTIIVCEGILGLTLLILLIQFKGKNNLNSINLILS